MGADSIHPTLLDNGVVAVSVSMYPVTAVLSEAVTVIGETVSEEKVEGMVKTSTVGEAVSGIYGGVNDSPTVISLFMVTVQELPLEVSHPVQLAVYPPAGKAVRMTTEPERIFTEQLVVQYERPPRLEETDPAFPILTKRV